MSKYPHMESFDPQECLSGKIGRIHRLTAAIFRKYMAPFGVSTSQVSLLFVLSKRESLTQKELSEITRLEKSTLNRNLRRLIERDYFDKKCFPKITITERGKQLVESIIPEWQKAMSEIRTILGAEDEKAIVSVHQKLINT